MPCAIASLIYPFVPSRNLCSKSCHLSAGQSPTTMYSASSTPPCCFRYSQIGDNLINVLGVGPDSVTKTSKSMVAARSRQNVAPTAPPIAYFPMTPSACIWFMASSVSFKAQAPCKYCGPTQSSEPSAGFQTKAGGRQVCRLPQKTELSFARPDSRGGRPYIGIALRGLAGALCFLGSGLLDSERLFAADVHFDLLGFGFSLFGQSDLQHAFVVVGYNLLRVHRGGQGESAGEGAIMTLHAAIVLFLLFLFDLALAVHGQRVVLDADIDVFLIDSWHFDLQGDTVLVFVNIDGRGKSRTGQSLVAASLVKGVTEQAVHPVLQGGDFAEWFPTGKNGHSKSSFRNWWCWNFRYSQKLHLSFLASGSFH